MLWIFLWKFQVLLKKLEGNEVSIQQDVRGGHGNNAMKTFLEVRRAVTETFRSIFNHFSACMMYWVHHESDSPCAFDIRTEYGTTMAYTMEELDFYGRSLQLFPQSSDISKERSQIYKERLQNSKERCLTLKMTVIVLQNDTTFSSRSVVPSGPP